MSATVPVEGAARALGRPVRLPLAPPAVGPLLVRALLVLVSFVVAGAAGLALYAQALADRVFEGVSAGGVPVGGLSVAEAEAVLEEAFVAYAGAPLTIEANGAAFALSPAAAGLSLDAEATVSRAMAWGRTGSIWERSQAWARGLTRGIAVPLVVDLDPARADSALRPAVVGVAVAPVDAWVRMDGGEPELVPDRSGVAIDAAATLAAIADRAAVRSLEPVPLVTRPVPAAISADDLAGSVPSARAAVDAPLLLRADDAVWHVPAADLARVVSVDRTGTLAVDREALGGLVGTLAVDIDREVADADVVVGDDGRLTAVASVEGAAVDVAASVDRLAAALLAGDAAADLVVARTAPAITTAAAEAAAVDGERRLEAGMPLRWDGGRAALDRGDLLRALTIRVRPGEPEPFVLGLDRDLIGERLDEIAAEVDEPVRDARFRVVAGKVTLAAEAREGRALETGRGVEGVLAAWESAKPGAPSEVELTVETIAPRWTGTDAAKIKLGDDVIAEGGTYYGDSSGPRRQNVELASSRLTGWLVPPGGVFSYAENIGPIDLASGYETGYGIVEQDGRFITAPVIGGGICQVSTTIFHAAFWAGLPIEERYQHPYYLRTYGEAVSGLPGLDAMVNIELDWALDLKFRNTTGNWLAVELVADGENLWSRILGTDPGWEVEVSEPVVSDRVAPDPKMYVTDSPELPRGQDLVVETASEGFDVSFTRTVRAGTKTLDTYTVSASFTAARNLTLRGTGPADMASPFA
ncbi:MAG: Vancomycin B-type resistance protein VanW [uncultured Thermomicrobiales bacterium]|uniref:Vancomycin B-type resistance protein VanW n=1 Tax=uncultured Thermomicrobiales bacterium TaxID=1645740 RepID=A0A6J4V0Z1_9BACT|nr:MAG: Vancomycin B-type resistance protein VanW [uncultured Thermomicrobiales bacterium]